MRRRKKGGPRGARNEKIWMECSRKITRLWILEGIRRRKRETRVVGTKMNENVNGGGDEGAYCAGCSTRFAENSKMEKVI